MAVRHGIPVRALVLPGPDGRFARRADDPGTVLESGVELLKDEQYPSAKRVRQGAGLVELAPGAACAGRLSSPRGRADRSDRPPDGFSSPGPTAPGVRSQ